MRVFVYGTLKKGYGNDVLLDEARIIGEFSLKNFKMVSLGGFPAIDRENNSSVLGEVYEIDGDILYSLDRLEGYHPQDGNNLYEREQVLVDNELTFVYVMPGCLEQYPPVESGVW